MKQYSTTELANRISRALITASNQTFPPLTWTPVLEQTLHGIGCRNSLNSQLVSRVIDPFLIHHHSLALGFFNWASQQPGFTHTSFSYQSILKSLSFSRQFTAVDRLMKQIKSYKIELHPSVYRLIIMSYLASRKAVNAFYVFSDVRLLIYDIGGDTCNALLAALASAGNIDYAHQVFDEMHARGVRLSTLGFGVFLWRICGTCELDKILSLIDDVKRQEAGVNGSIIAILVVHGLCLAGRVQDAMYLLGELRKRDCKPDFMAYRVVAEALRENGCVVDVENVLKMKRKRGVAPRVSDYRDFILQLISERLICEAKDLGEVIVSGNFPIDDDVLNALIGSVSADDPCSALMFLKFLVSKESFPTPLTLNNLSKNLCKHKKHDELVKSFELLSAKEYFVDIERYKVMVLFFCKAGKVKEAYEMLQEMKKKGLGPDIECYNYVMEACCKEDMIRPAKRLWDEMFANGCEANLKTYNILILKLLEIGQLNEGYTIFCHMLERGIEPELSMYVFLIKGLCEEKQVETALEVFKKSLEQDVKIAQTIMGKFIVFLCREGQFRVASDLVHDYTSTFNSESHMMLLKCLADAGEIDVAIEHMTKVGQLSPSMLHELRVELLSSLSSSSKSQKILELVRVIDSLYQNHVVSKTDSS
ncbi:pentatricopeptide repeat-containing protein At5g14080 [Rutidosis leptorrhynchoides]|uniref:pentatricopeptide repeat-containing protein At5g14080 n=1 Tax=Rutidosis leptorrhynchoides TaxID=125765 RepID=UPI003A99F4BD